MTTLSQLAVALDEGRISSRSLVEACLARIDDPSLEGHKAYVKLYADEARACADAIDVMRAKNYSPSPFAGIPISVKDLFDVKGDVTLAGSRVLAHMDAAHNDADVVAHLRHAGFIIMGRTHMTEFAFSGVGLNPHFDTPHSIWDRQAKRIPGGSSSGAAISVADGMAFGAIGTDTGGSCRIPAALNGLVGYKPTAQRISRRGAFPLSTSLDSIGPLANRVECCAILDAFMAHDNIRPLRDISLSHARIAVPKTIVLNDMDDHVAHLFERCLKIMRDTGAHIDEIDVAEYSAIGPLNSKGGFAAAESYYIHHTLIDRFSALYDPRVISRILRGREQSAVDYIELCTQRQSLIKSYHRRMRDYDFCLYPTVPIIAPPQSAFADDNDYARLNLLLLRNPALINVLDGCAISVPVHRADEAPVGLMLSKCSGGDEDLFVWARALERVLMPANHEA
jgi:aspartyl-tRNA(Asn)/glutamyl-tRNA(Gln) amidotransferase subunit A